MKRTHMSLGVYDQGWRVNVSNPWGRPVPRVREKHRTACGMVCDKTKATTDRAKVTCIPCMRKVG